MSNQGQKQRGDDLASQAECPSSQMICVQKPHSSSPLTPSPPLRATFCGDSTLMRISFTLFFLCFLHWGMLRNISGFSPQSVRQNQTYFVLLFLRRRLFCCFLDVSVNELTMATQLLQQGPTKVSSSLCQALTAAGMAHRSRHSQWGWVFEGGVELFN